MVVACATIEEAQKRIIDVGNFSPPLEQILIFLLKETESIKSESRKENEARKAELNAKIKEIDDRLNQETDRIKEVLKRENEERQRELRDLEAFVKKENAERKAAEEKIQGVLNAENEKRMKEAAALKEKMEKEKKEMQEYLEQDAKQMKAKMDTENKALQEKLEREAAGLKAKLNEADERTAKESKALAARLEAEKKALADQLESGNKEVEERMRMEEERRKREADELKTRMENAKQEQGNSITQMFDRLKAENDTRKTEIHGLKDILVRENECRARETDELRLAMELANQTLGEALEKESNDLNKRMLHLEEDLGDEMKKTKKELKEKIDSDCNDLKRKIEVETNEIRDKAQIEKKAMVNKMEEDDNDRRKEIGLIKNQLQKEREELRSQAENDSKMILRQVDKDCADVMAAIKKERADRERDSDMIKERIDNERKEIQISVDKDRENMTRRLAEEHDMRRLEQMEMQQRFDNNEKAGKTDIQELFNKIKREQEIRENDADDLREKMNNTRSAMEERIIKERQTLRDSLDQECLDVNKRVDKLNVDRMADVADTHNKIALFGKSAQRHLDALRAFVIRECQNLFDLTTKTCSVVFDAVREENYIDGGEDYVTFSGCTVNIGNAMCPKSGEFTVPEPGLYLFLVTLCTYDMKKCLISIRKNGKDVANIHDQDGDTNKGKTMIGQNVLMELVEGDKIQLYAYTSTGITDHKASHYTQFIGVLLRPAIDTLAAAMRRLGTTDFGDEEIGADDISLMSNRGMNGDVMSGRNRRGGSKSRLLSPPPSSAGNNNTAASVSNQVLPEGSIARVRGSSAERLLSPPPVTSPGVVNGHHGMSSNGSGKNLLHMSHNGSASIIEEEEEVESPTPSKQVPVVPVSDNLVDLDKSTTSIPAQTKEENKSMSYLALTKLGMGKKEGTETKVDPSNDSNPVSDPKAKKTSPKEPKKIKEKKVKDIDDQKKKSKPMISLLR